MKTYEFDTNENLAKFIMKTPGKLAIQLLAEDSCYEVFVEKSSIAEQLKYTKGDAEFYVIRRDDEDHHVLIKAIG